MSASHPVSFVPYKGKDYYKYGNRIFILGESHYCPRGRDCKCRDRGVLNECTNKTNEVVTSYLDYKKGEYSFEYWMRNFSKFANVLNGKPLRKPKQFLGFWEHVLFYNYTQVPMIASGISPTKDDFQRSYDAFASVLQDNNDARFVFIWADRLWENLPKQDFIITKRRPSTTSGYVKTGSVTIPFCQVPHPRSSKYNYSLHEEVKEDLRAAGITLEF